MTFLLGVVCCHLDILVGHTDTVLGTMVARSGSNQQVLNRLFVAGTGASVHAVASCRFLLLC